MTEAIKIESLMQFVDVDDCDSELAGRSLLDFIKYTWYKKEAYVIGRHTIKICERIDKLIKRFEKGKSSCIAITIPPRHGKSHIVSRALPTYFKGKFIDSELLITGYADSLLNEFSKDARDRIVGRAKFKRVFPGYNLARNNKSISSWNLEYPDGEEVNGGINYAGILGGLTGKGYELGVCDDPFKNREEAESLIMRDKVWNEFTDSFLTRKADVSITIILMTRWHIDDIIGRIEDRMNPKHSDYQPDFPQFEIINYPAKSDEYESGYLFTEKFPEKWYKAHFGTLSKYAASSLMQGEPVVREGNLLKVDGVKIHDNLKGFPSDIIYWRVWDLAHSKKEKMKGDPDWTAGTLMGVPYEKKDGFSVPVVWIKDVFRIRESAPVRDKNIKRITNMDGDGVKVAIEANTDSKDTFETFMEIMKGIRSIVRITSHKDKVVRAEPLEAVFEAGNVHILRADWNMEWFAEVSAFPNAKHDDMVDNLSSGFNQIKSGGGVIGSVHTEGVGMGVQDMSGSLI